MAEAIALVALAGNVLQFLEAGGRFAARALDICRHAPSNQDGPSNLRRIRQVSNDFQALYEKLQAPTTQSAAPGSQSSQSRGLVSLSADCSEVIQEVLQKLSKIGTRDGQKRTNLILAEFKAAWHKRDIHELESRMVGLREQLAAHLIVTLRDLAMKSLSQQDAILSEIKDLRSGAKGASSYSNKGETGPVHAPGEILVNSLFNNLEEEDENQELDLLMVAMQKKLENFHSNPNVALQAKNPELQVTTSRKVQVQKDFILSLNYKERDYRESAIASPYDATFQWIFYNGPNRENAEFSRWLKSESKIFWITGKAGSGKSTLMKYVSDFKSEGRGASLCQQHLMEWAGVSELVTASFYFWASGSPIEGSQKAMLKSLLFQLLQDHPDIISRIAPGVWESACLFNTRIRNSWTEDILAQALLNAVKQLRSRGAKLCFFIDGLDEFDGKPSTLISLIQQMVGLSNVKLCVSSRPWVEFEDAFRKKPTLRVQDLTYGDIKHFVVSHFDESEGFRRLKLREPGYARSLTHQIVEKSAGVFLWVRIVVQSLLAGLTNDDRIRDLENRLRSLPPDLEQLYNKILDDLDPFYFEHACQYFALMQKINGSASAILLSFVDEEDPDFAIRLPTRPLRESKRVMRVQTLRRRLNSRCKGLLEIGRDGRVNFLHRTVREYLDRPGIRSKMDAVVQKSQFDPCLELCSASLAMTKSVNPQPAPGERSDVPLIRAGKFLKRCLHWASMASGAADGARLLRIMHSLHRLLKFHPELFQPGHYRESIIGGRLTITENPTHHYTGDGFLNIATRFNVVKYVESKVQLEALSDLKCQYVSISESNSQPGHLSLACLVLNAVGHVRHAFSRGGKSVVIGSPLPLLLDACLGFPPNIEIFRCLLDNGGDVNQVMRIPCLLLKLVDTTLGGGQRYDTVVFQTRGASLIAIVVAAALLTTIDASSSRMEQTSIDPWELWGKWSEILRLFVKHGARLDRGLASAVGSGIRPWGSRFRSTGSILKVLETISTKRLHGTVGRWMELWDLDGDSSSDGGENE